MQKEMRVARCAIDFCYVCGKPLPPRGPGFKKQVIGEHVVPRNLLGEAPPTDAWAVELDVHRHCEEVAKSVDDSLLSLLLKINTTDAAEWPDPGHVRNLDFEMLAFVPNDGSFAIPAFGNADRVLKGAWTWIRGLHSALYREALALDATWCVFPPVPACSTSGGLSMSDAETHSFVCRATLQLGVKCDKWDGIDAWGQRLQFRCVWKHVPKEHGGPAWWCFWGLLFPGVLEWSRNVLGSGLERPWHGHYVVSELPAGASYLVSEDFPGDD